LARALQLIWVCAEGGVKIVSKWAFCIWTAGLFFFLSIRADAQSVTLLSADYGVEGSRMDVTCRVQSMVQNGYLHFRITNYLLGGDPAPEQPKEFRIRARDFRGRVYDYNFHEKEDVALQASDPGPDCPHSVSTSRWQGRLSDDDQQRFDSYFTRWLTYSQQNNQRETQSMLGRMYDVYNHYGIPTTVPFNQIASPLAVAGNSAYSDLQLISASYGIPGRTVDVTNRLRGIMQNGSLAVHVNNDSMGADPAPEKHKALTLTYSYRGQRRTVTVRESDDLTLP
jgi:hypothetical protein